MDSPKVTQSAVASSQEPNDQELSVFVQNLLEQMVQSILFFLSSIFICLLCYIFLFLIASKIHSYVSYDHWTNR